MRGTEGCVKDRFIVLYAVVSYWINALQLRHGKLYHVRASCVLCMQCACLPGRLLYVALQVTVRREDSHQITRRSESQQGVYGPGVKRRSVTDQKKRIDILI